LALNRRLGIRTMRFSAFGENELAISEKSLVANGHLPAINGSFPAFNRKVKIRNRNAETAIQGRTFIYYCSVKDAIYLIRYIFPKPLVKYWSALVSRFSISLPLSCVMIR
jgi:hypothetical protein